MSVVLKDLLAHCEATLEPHRFSDYCPNGLQVEGKLEVSRLATAVTANQSVIDEAVAWGADALLVHHGYFWRGEEQPIVGMKRRRIASLLAAQMSLIAYHLPLDAHPVLGNNAQLGARLGIEEEGGFAADVGSTGRFLTPISSAALVAQLEELTGRVPLLIEPPVGQAAVPEDRLLSRVAWCTGAAQGYIEQAAAAGVEVYISGEISEPTVHIARELGLVYIAAGHHATERYGVQALGGHLADEFSLEWTFIDCDNPV